MCRSSLLGHVQGLCQLQSHRCACLASSSWSRHLLSAFLGSLGTDSPLCIPLSHLPQRATPLLPGMKDIVPVRESQKVPWPLASDQHLLQHHSLPASFLLGWQVGNPTWGVGQTQVLPTCNPHSELSDLGR